jgi:hypothetical protein
VTLIGLGEPYYVHIAVNTPTAKGGWIGSGLLPIGQTITHTFQEPSLFLPLIVR